MHAGFNLNDLLALDSTISTLLSGGILTLLSSTFALLWKGYKSLKAKDKLLDDISKNQEEMMKKIKEIETQGNLRQEANLASLHDRIYSNFDLVFSRNPPTVTIDELNNLEYLWEAYSGLGGNGTGKKMYERINDLPIQEGNSNAIKR